MPAGTIATTMNSARYHEIGSEVFLRRLRFMTADLFPVRRRLDLGDQRFEPVVQLEFVDRGKKVVRAVDNNCLRRMTMQYLYPFVVSQAVLAPDHGIDR